MTRIAFGNIRVVTHNGEGDTVVPARDITRRLIDAHSLGGGVIELSTYMGPSGSEEKLVKTRPCGLEEGCPVIIKTNPNKAKAILSTRSGFPIPEKCLECAGRTIVTTVGLMPERTGTDDFIAEEV